MDRSIIEIPIIEFIEKIKSDEDGFKTYLDVFIYSMDDDNMKEIFKKLVEKIKKESIEQLSIAEYIEFVTIIQANDGYHEFCPDGIRCNGTYILTWEEQIQEMCGPCKCFRDDL